MNNSGVALRRTNRRAPVFVSIGPARGGFILCGMFAAARFHSMASPAAGMPDVQSIGSPRRMRSWGIWCDRF
jgi:hypothetical protein